MKSVVKAVKLTMPAFYRNKPAYLEISKDLQKLNKKYAALLQEVEEQIDDQQLDADTLIEQIFEKAKIVADSDDILHAAADRAKRGNPPGKKNGQSIGDEINWEALLESVPSKKAIHIVSVDGDYSSVRDPSRLSDFLHDEWANEKDADAILYRGLSEFFAVHFKRIKLAADVAKATAIDRLASSSSFGTTHSAIAKLVPHLGTFTPSEAERLVEIANENNQVGWIIGDPDVKDFFVGLTQTAGLKEDVLQQLEEMLPEDEQQEA
jgi:hypothetical protein